MFGLERERVGVAPAPAHRTPRYGQQTPWIKTTCSLDSRAPTAYYYCLPLLGWVPLLRVISALGSLWGDASNDQIL